MDPRFGVSVVAPPLLGDSFSRNPKDRDTLLASETGDRGTGLCRFAASGARPGSAGLCRMEGARLRRRKCARRFYPRFRGSVSPFEGLGVPLRKMKVLPLTLMVAYRN